MRSNLGDFFMTYGITSMPPRSTSHACRLSDRAKQHAELLYAALRDAIMKGSKHVNVRFWKNKGEGLMTQTEKERGYSSQYAILGMVTWPEVHAQKLPKWAIPTDYRAPRKILLAKWLRI